MTRGPAPKPTALKILAGNPGKRALNSREPHPRVSARVPRVPNYLSDDAKRVWRKLAPRLHEAGLLTEVDVYALAQYCTLYARWRQAEKALASDGPVITTSNGNMVQSPWMGIANRALEMMNRLAREFGMTPASRSRISVDAPDDDDLLTQLFAGVAIGEHEQQKR